VHNTYANKWAIRDGNWLLIQGQDGYHSRRQPDWETRHNYPKDDDQAVELYDLKEDIGQRSNVAADHLELVSRLSALLHTTRERGFSAPRLINQNSLPPNDDHID
jgi:arylsulfatase A